LETIIVVFIIKMQNYNDR